MKKTILLAAGFTLAASMAMAQDGADRIWFGGSIITMEDGNMRADAVAVREGRILAVGSEEEVMSHKDAQTEIIDLGDRALLPGFVDSHGHVVMGGLQALSANLLAPPDGEVRDITSLQDTLRTWIEANAHTVENVNLIIGFGYDPAQLTELRHPTREELDAVSTDFPVYIVHQSGHFGSANSKALEVIGYTSDTKDPSGGIIRRLENGEPDGVLEETAHIAAIVKLLANLGPSGFEAFATAGADLWARFGYTTAQEGRSMPGTVKVMQKVAAEDGFNIDIVTYPDVLVDRNFIKEHSSRNYTNRLRVGGAKLTIDGSPQGFTAWRDRPYYDPVGNYEPGYKGYAAATQEETFDAIDWAYENDIQIITHANGEAASDLLISSIEAARSKYGGGDRRPVLIHGQFLREDQVDSYKALGVFPSLFPMHTFYWGDWHRDHTVGPINAENISPTGWLVKRGMRFGSHHDAPVAFPDSIRVLAATVTRRTRSGDILGPNQRVDVITALKSMTIWPAYQHFEEDQKGSLAVGKLADFVILSTDPTAVDPEELDTLDVVETIKEGVTIFTGPGKHTQKTELNQDWSEERQRSFAHTLRGIIHSNNVPSSSHPFAQFLTYAKGDNGNPFDSCVAPGLLGIFSRMAHAGPASVE
ncbi:MAG: amidohydrolase [Pseudomonadota bacterium]